MDPITKSAQESIRPYLNDKDQMISIAKTLQASHYDLLTTHADLSRSIKKLNEQIEEKREQAISDLDDYKSYKSSLADLIDQAMSTKVNPSCTPEKIQNAIDIVNDLTNHLDKINGEIINMKSDLAERTDKLNEVISTKNQNMVLSQVLQTAIQNKVNN